LTFHNTLPSNSDRARTMAWATSSKRSPSTERKRSGERAPNSTSRSGVMRGVYTTAEAIVGSGVASREYVY